jgi:predicted dehydrogenase
MPVKNKPINRRRFLGLSASAAAMLALPNRTVGARELSPNSKLDVAFIGMGSQIQGHVQKTAHEGHNVVALCDVDENQIAQTKERHGDSVSKAAAYSDYRKLFENESSFDAVVIATPDHWHAPIIKRALEAQKHVYCEKPLTHTIAEARMIRELSRESKVVTQMGNQGSSTSGLRRSMELIEAGLFGNISQVHMWHPTHNWPSGVNRPIDANPIPDGLDWDFWCGPAPLRPYNDEIYHPMKWRGWYDFGNGSLGDFCCHAFNLPARALKLDYPNRIEISGEGLGFESFTTASTTRLYFPAKDKRGPVVLNFYTGTDLPPKELYDLATNSYGGEQGTGCILVGDKGLLWSGLWNSECYVKLNDEEHFVAHKEHEAVQEIPQTLPRLEGHMNEAHIKEWIDAILTGSKTYSDFDRGGHLTELGLAGIVALKLQKNIEWNGPNMKVVGMPEADILIDKQNRTKWL